MKPAAVRRFSIAEIVLHWANAVLYLALFITGILILINRIFEVEIALPESLSLIHRIAGISLISVFVLTIISTIFLKGFGQLRDSLRQSVTWRLGDFIWLIKVPLNMFHHRLMLPLADRFNPGQKLHLLAVFSVLLGTAISGIAMMVIRGALAFWVIHLICFVLAALFLALHMFLSLINPTTRKALSAIFTGLISIEYARQHHPLWIKHNDSAHHGSYVSLLAVTLTAAATVAVVIVLGVYSYGTTQSKNAIKRLMLQRGANAIAPGRLIAGHANDLKLKKCTACHGVFSFPSSDSCLDCHELIAERLNAQSGFHGKLAGQCRSCHRDHAGEDADILNFDAAQFDHNFANFKLQGTHSKLPCSKCHLAGADENTSAQTKYIGLPITCEKCHDDIEKLSYGIAARMVSKPDPHAGRVTCGQCHQANKQRQTPADYADKCKSCHNDKYEQYYYDWSTSFGTQKTKAEKLLSILQQKNSSEANKIAEQIKESEYTGFHNIQLANKLWEQIFFENIN